MHNAIVHSEKYKNTNVAIYLDAILAILEVQSAK